MTRSSLRVGQVPALLLAAVFVTGCASASRSAAHSEVAPAGQLAEGTIAILTSLDGSTCKDGRSCAEVQSLRTLLFVGVPGSRIPQPMVRNEQDALRTHGTYFKDLIDGKGYARFVIRSVEVDENSRPRAGSKRWNVVINSDALRRSLEQAGVVRPFGY